ncbi:SPOR domain-containing protein [Phaeobacter sp. QD34_3]|uniref:SPOR domain-containing protein n=1 Tax=unclassified Phaeobacter TaxID=2621772 RepID=UPI00237EF920|nr:MULTISPECIES: SPOR domain-containing protein [unclassified Phaeobacter]MDE4134129.1 SPOR domain-containing protein [Phaeobacter sp. QD34_3]MDE4137948.1 SPOR domain-containing protein [Phaeobacter sp. QD34_24]
MRITRIVALALIAGTFGLQGAEAQTLRASGPPSEVPPASYKGKQYVDSRGCIYIRAGIDGNVSWVPRVTRSRKQLCGYKPTTIAGTTKTGTGGAPAFEMITLPESQRPGGATTTTASAAAAQTAPAASVRTPAPAPRVVTTAKPRRTASSTSATPARVTASVPPRVVKPAPVAPAPAPVIRQVSPAAGGCPGASAISQQYINSGANVRCGPQAESPVTYGRGGRYDQNSSLQLAPNTPVVPAHVYHQRRYSSDLSVPEGYRPVWKDDRLNLRRAERTIASAVIRQDATVPPGYVRVERDDDRMNAMRAQRTAEGDARMAEIWTDKVPRTLVRQPLDRPTVRLSGHQARSAAEAREPLMMRLSTRSDPAAETASSDAGPRRYVRAATFADPEAARRAAQALARSTGLPVRLGTATRNGKPYKVVLAGPFTGDGAGEAALNRVRGAGYPKARLSK